MNVPRTKLLGHLETADRRLIAVGGAQLNADGTGFFITEPGAEMPPIFPGQEGRVSSVHGIVIVSVANLQAAPATSALPRRYTFNYADTVPVETALSKKVHATPGESRVPHADEAGARSIDPFSVVRVWQTRRVESANHTLVMRWGLPDNRLN